MSNNPQHQSALNLAIDLMDMCPDLEPKSALKQAGNDKGIPYGPEMQEFVDWAYAKLPGE